MVVDADVVAAGGGSLDGRSFGLFVDAKNYLTDRTATGEFSGTLTFRGLRPVFIHGAAGTTLQEPTTGKPADAYFVNHFIAAKKRKNARIAAITSRQLPVLRLAASQQTKSRICCALSVVQSGSLIWSDWISRRA